MQHFQQLKMKKIHLNDIKNSRLLSRLKAFVLKKGMHNNLLINKNIPNLGNKEQLKV